jgi:hypothetical protein
MDAPSARPLGPGRQPCGETQDKTQDETRDGTQDETQESRRARECRLQSARRPGAPAVTPVHAMPAKTRYEQRVYVTFPHSVASSQCPHLRSLGKGANKTPLE